EVSARDVGERVHRILRRFYEGFERGAGEGWLALASERLLAIAREEMNTGRQDLFWRARARDLMAGLASGTRAEDRRGALRRFVEREAEADGRRPHRFEAEFQVSLDLAIADVPGARRFVANGRIDRVDVEEEQPPRVGGAADLRRGEAEPGPGFVVYDYKTGKRVPDVREALEGRSFQLPLYLLGARALAGEGRRPIGAAYYPVGDPHHMRLRWLAEKGAVEASRGQRGLVPDLGAALERVPPAIGTALDGMAAGLFHPGDLSPDRKGCQFCDFRRICRVDDARMKRLFDGGGPGVFRPLPLVPPVAEPAPAAAAELAAGA
ncbi:MAG TPA: PD-(D/E)XK nuclease family protein, partial [Planctomycetota bacterium]|nr:PD-(D/E)XK nuclease family protein [Planctomycetota bacterium]